MMRRTTRLGGVSSAESNREYDKISMSECWAYRWEACISTNQKF